MANNLLPRLGHELYYPSLGRLLAHEFTDLRPDPGFAIFAATIISYSCTTDRRMASIATNDLVDLPFSDSVVRTHHAAQLMYLIVGIASFNSRSFIVLTYKKSLFKAALFKQVG